MEEFTADIAFEGFVDMPEFYGEGRASYRLAMVKRREDFLDLFADAAHVDAVAYGQSPSLMVQMLREYGVGSLDVLVGNVDDFEDESAKSQPRNLFRMAGELADRRGDDAVREHHVREAQEAAARDRTLTQMRGLSVQKRLALYATAAVSVFDDCLASVPNSVSYEVYNFVTELVSVDQKSRDSFLRYLNECETYNFVVSETKGQGYAKGVVKNYSFVDDAKTVLETLESGLEMDELAEDRELVRSVVESEISEFLD